MSKAEHIEDLIAPTVEDMGFELVRVRFLGTDRLTLQIMAERPDGSMSVDDCADLSRAISAILDVADPVAGEYRLEISSPGIDRPLTRPKDFVNFAGFEARVELRQLTDGRRRYRGVLAGLEGDKVLLSTDSGDVQLSLADIADAKLVLTDELLAAHAGS